MFRKRAMKFLRSSHLIQYMIKIHITRKHICGNRIPIIENVLEGYNGTIFAYGWTGQGRHLLSVGCPRIHSLRESCLGHSKEYSNLSNVTQEAVPCSCLIPWNLQRRNRDLLSKNGSAKLDLKEKDNTAYVKDLSTFVVKTPDNMMRSSMKGQSTTMSSLLIWMISRPDHIHCLL